jgi:hypothetical protein
MDAQNYVLASCKPGTEDGSDEIEVDMNNARPTLAKRAEKSPPGDKGPYITSRWDGDLCRAVYECDLNSAGGSPREQRPNQWSVVPKHHKQFSIGPGSSEFFDQS